MSKTVPNLTGVPETMLWTLYNRAIEAKRADRVLNDPETVKIFDSLDYDFAKSFGDPDGAHPMRALESDRLLRAFLAKHPGGTVVSLGEGLDTQALRVDDGRVRWLTVDLPESIAVRERFIPSTERRVHIAKSALDRAWLEAAGAGPVFVIAQGLFMYFTEDDVRSLVKELAERFPGGELFFDTIPRVLSGRTMKGTARRTPHYTLPKMPWGIDVHELDAFMRSCSPKIVDVAIIRYRRRRGWLRLMLGVMAALLGIRNKRPAMVHARFGR